MRRWWRKRLPAAVPAEPLRRHVWEVDREASSISLAKLGLIAMRCRVCGVLRPDNWINQADEHRWPEKMRRELLLEPCKGTIDPEGPEAKLAEWKRELALGPAATGGEK